MTVARWVGDLAVLMALDWAAQMVDQTGALKVACLVLPTVVKLGEPLAEQLAPQMVVHWAVLTVGSMAASKAAWWVAWMVVLLAALLAAYLAVLMVVDEADQMVDSTAAPKAVHLVDD